MQDPLPNLKALPRQTLPQDPRTPENQAPTIVEEDEEDTEASIPIPGDRPIPLFCVCE